MDNIINILESFELESLEKYIKNPVYKLSKNTLDALIHSYGNMEPLTIHRGLNFDSPLQYQKFMNTIKDGNISITGMSSWSRDEEEAMNFAITKPTFTLNQSLASQLTNRDDGEVMTGYQGIVLTIRIPRTSGVDVGLTPHAAEDEIILPRGTYKIVNCRVLSPFKNMIDMFDLDDTIKKTMNKTTISDSYMDRFSEYILRKYPQRLKKDTINEIIQKYGGVGLKPENVSIVEVDNDYFDYIMYIKFNPWLFLFFHNGLLDEEATSLLMSRGKQLLNHIKEMVAAYGKVSLKSNGVEELSHIIDNGRSYDDIIKLTMAPSRETRHINSLRGAEKKDAIKREKDRLVAMLKDVE